MKYANGADRDTARSVSAHIQRISEACSLTGAHYQQAVGFALSAGQIWCLENPTCDLFAVNLLYCACFVDIKIFFCDFFFKEIS